jgi:hypothetical protein
MASNPTDLYVRANPRTWEVGLQQINNYLLSDGIGLGGRLPIKHALALKRGVGDCQSEKGCGRWKCSDRYRLERDLDPRRMPRSWYRQRSE